MDPNSARGLDRKVWGRRKEKKKATHNEIGPRGGYRNKRRRVRANCKSHGVAITDLEKDRKS